MKDTSQTIPFNTNNTIACKRFMEAKIDGILIIMGRKIRLILICLIFLKIYRNFGEDGISVFLLGLGIMYIFRLEEIEKVKLGHVLICL